MKYLIIPLMALTLCAQLLCCKKDNLTIEIINQKPQPTNVFINNSYAFRLADKYTAALPKHTTFKTTDTCLFQIKENGTIIAQHRGLQFEFKTKRKIEN